MTILDALRWVPIITSFVALGIALYTARIVHRRAEAEHQHALDAEAALDAMVVAHDPGRDVHQRLAAAMEADIIRSGGSAKPDPAARRLAAMAMATKILETCRNANLQVVDEDGAAGDPQAAAAAFDAAISEARPSE